jgi:hypothetical protein|tara:strand:- start:450 stop:635 length:186 start_codon:yes stop_codon:yes gene_type:complete
MNDNDLEKIQTVDVNVTSESMDAHVICLRENGYKVLKKSSAYIRYILFFLLGAYTVGLIMQ